MNTITPVELKPLLDSRPELPLIDVRTPAEFSEVRVPQARNVPLDELQPKALSASGQLTPGEPFYLICRSGTRSSHAAAKFEKEGFTRVFVVEGGTLAWEEAGLPVQRSGGKVISLERQVRIAAGLLVLTGVILGWLLHPGFFGLAAFVGAGLVFAGITDYCGMALLLGKLPYNKRKPVPAPVT